MHTTGLRWYNLTFLFQVNPAGKFSESRLPSEAELLIKSKAFIPAPGQYDVGPQQPPKGGKFNIGNSKSEIEWMMHRARNGPQSLCDPPKLPAPSGGRFNLSKPKNEFEWVEYWSKQVPGPADYDTRLPLMTSGGKFSEVTYSDF